MRKTVKPPAPLPAAVIVERMIARRQPKKKDDGHSRQVSGLLLNSYVKREPYTDPATVEGWLYRKGLAALNQAQADQRSDQEPRIPEPNET